LKGREKRLGLDIQCLGLGLNLRSLVYIPVCALDTGRAVKISERTIPSGTAQRLGGF